MYISYTTNLTTINNDVNISDILECSSTPIATHNIYNERAYELDNASWRDAGDFTLQGNNLKYKVSIDIQRFYKCTTSVTCEENAVYCRVIDSDTNMIIQSYVLHDTLYNFTPTWMNVPNITLIGDIIATPVSQTYTVQVLITTTGINLPTYLDHQINVQSGSTFTLTKYDDFNTTTGIIKMNELVCSDIICNNIINNNEYGVTIIDGNNKSGAPVHIYKSESDLSNVLNNGYTDGQAIPSGFTPTGYPATGYMSRMSVFERDNYYIVKANFGIVVYDSSNVIQLAAWNKDNRPQTFKPILTDKAASIKLFYNDVEVI